MFRCACLFLSIVFAWPLSAGASDVTFYYSGLLNHVANENSAPDGSGPVTDLFDPSVDHAFTLKFTFDPVDPNPAFSPADHDPDPHFGEYLNILKSVELTIGSFSATGARGATPGTGLVGDILIVNDGAQVGTGAIIDEYVTVMTGLTTSLGPAAIIIDLVSEHGNEAGGPPFTSDALPTETVTTGAWLHPNTFFTLDFLTADGEEMLGSIASIADENGFPAFDAAVPLPPALVLFLSAFSVLVISRRRSGQTKPKR